METLTTYNPELARPLVDEVTEEEVLAVTPRHFALSARNRGESYSGASKTFLKMFRQLGKTSFKDALVVDKDYGGGNLTTHVGIRLDSFLDLIQHLDEILPPTSPISHHSFQAFNEDLFSPESQN